MKNFHHYVIYHSLLFISFGMRHAQVSPDMHNQEPFWKVGHQPTLVCALLYFTFSFMVWVLLGALGNYIASDFGLSPFEKGLMIALPILSGSLLRLVMGPMADIIGAKKTGMVGLALTLAPLAGGWLWADSVGRIYVVGLMLGIAGASFAVAMPMASRWYPQRHQGMVLGIVGAGTLGAFVAMLLAPRLAEVFGWRAVFGIAAIVLLAVMVVFVLVVRDAPRKVEAPKLSEYSNLFKEKDAYLFCLFYSVTFGGFVGLASFLPVMLWDQYQISKVQAGEWAAVCVFSGGILRPLGGWLADRVGGIRVLIGVYILAAMSAWLAAGCSSLGACVLLMVLVLGSFGIGNGAVFQLVPQRFSKQIGTATSIVGTAGGLGGFLLPLIFGELKQITGSYSSGLYGLAGCSVLALFILLVVQHKWIGLWVGEGGMARRAASIFPEETLKTETL